jgi:hypothetical protein
MTLKFATGKYFRFAAHDDLVAPNLIEKCVRFLERNPDYVMCFGDSMRIDENGTPLGVYRCDTATSPDTFERFVNLASYEHICHEACGLMRTHMLRRIGGHGNYPDADRALLVHLGLLGKFHRVAEPLLYKREHPGMSTRAFPDRYARMAWFGEQHKTRMTLPHFMQAFHYLKIIAVSPLSIGLKLKCYAHILRHLDYRSLLKDIAKTCERLVQRPIAR